jgi:UDP-2-acetamido-3-amino-2,3-dideoxy-glucuronate N-acetyltransferase
MIIHNSADVQTTDIGQNTRVWQWVVILKNAKIGTNCNICSHCLIENDVTIGNNVTIKSGVQLWDGLYIEDDVFIGPNVTFTNDLYPRSKKYPEEFLKTKVKKGASLGANSTILSGIEIGEYSMIGAASLVTKNIPKFTLWYGNPAKHRGYITREGQILTLELVGKNDQKQYLLENGEPKLK